VVGQLSGNPNTMGNYCAEQIGEYGRFDLSWTGGGTNSTRLSNWLDPSNSGAMTTNTTNVSALIPTTFSISGDNLFCTTSNPYTIPNLPAGSIVSWSTTPTGIATPGTPNSTQTTLIKSANGVITLTATITNACGGPITLTKNNIVVGTPDIPNINALQAGGTCYYDAAVTLSAPSTTVEFSFNSTTWFAGIQNGNVFRSGNAEFLGPMYKMVYARTSNACGKGPVFSRNLYIPKPPTPCEYIAQRKSAVRDSANVSKISIDAINASASNSSIIHVYPTRQTRS
jgi:hypothetical protein